MDGAPAQTNHSYIGIILNLSSAKNQEINAKENHFRRTTTSKNDTHKLRNHWKETLDRAR